MSNPRTTFQEVYFDLCDFVLNGGIPDEFENITEFIETQRDKLESIESDIFGDETV